MAGCIMQHIPSWNTGSHNRLICLCEIDFMSCFLPADDTLALAFFLAEGDAAGGGLGILLDFGFALGQFAPPGVGPAVLDYFFQFLIIFRIENMGIPEGGGALQQRFLNV